MTYLTLVITVSWYYSLLWNFLCKGRGRGIALSLLYFLCYRISLVGKGRAS